MDNNHAPDSDLEARVATTRPTIGLFTYGLMDTIGQAVWQGMEDVARERDVNLICCSGGTLSDLSGMTTPANVLYNLVGAERVDGLVIWSAMLHHVDLERAWDFYRRYAASVPTVSIGLQVDAIPTVMVDNYTGMYSLVEHLIEVHNHRRIAFVRGPAGYAEAEDRYRAYHDALAAHDLEVDLALVSPGNNQRSGGEEAVALWLDARGLRPGIDFEAVVAANDNMAFGVLAALDERGIHVPEEVAVVGFDDFEEARHTLPPLTTVTWPGYMQGRQAAELLLAMVQHNAAPELTHVSTDLIVRESCGCVIPAVQQAGESMGLPVPGAQLDAPVEALLAAERDTALEEMAQALGALANRARVEALAGLWDVYAAALAPEPDAPASETRYLSALSDLVRQTVSAEGDDVNAWQAVVTVLRHRALATIGVPELRIRIESLCHQARVLISYEAYRVQAQRVWETQNQAAQLRAVEQALLTASDLDHFTNVFRPQLEALDIPGCALVLYEDADAETPTLAQMLVAYDARGRSGQETRLFPARRLLPDALWPYERRFSLVLEGLYVRAERFGHVLFEIGPHTTALYSALRDQLSSALHAVLMIEENRRRVAREQTIGAITARIRETLDLSTVLQTAVRELGLAMEADVVEVRLGAQIVPGDNDDDGSILLPEVRL